MQQNNINKRNKNQRWPRPRQAQGLEGFTVLKLFEREEKGKKNKEEKRIKNQRCPRPRPSPIRPGAPTGAAGVGSGAWAWAARADFFFFSFFFFFQFFFFNNCNPKHDEAEEDES